MATTRLMPLHSGKGRTVAEALGRVTDYVKNPEKTDDGDLVTAYQCNPSIADQEFLFSKRQYAAITGRERKDNDVMPTICGSLSSRGRSRRNWQTRSVVTSLCH